MTGSRVSAGGALVELETEKIDLEVSADRAGVLASIKHPAGADVKVGEVLALLDAPAQAAALEREDNQASESASPVALPDTTIASAPSVRAPGGPLSGGKRAR